VHSTSDPDAILRTAVREVSDALGKPAFVKLGQAAPTRNQPTDDFLPAPEIELDSGQLPTAAPPENGESEER
jgi:hypothetical protein